MYDLDPSPQKKRLHSLPAQLVDSENENLEVTPVVEEVEARVPGTSQAQPEDGGADALGIVDGLQMDVGSMPKKKRGRPRKSGESSISAPALDAELILDPVDEAAHVEPKPNRKARPGKETNSTSNGDGSSTALPKKLRRLNGPTMESPGMPDFEEVTVERPEWGLSSWNFKV